MSIAWDDSATAGYRLDRDRLRAAFDRAASHYEDYAVLQDEIRARLIERLDWMRIQPRRILDLGAGTGQSSEALMRRYPKARVVGLDWSEAMARRVGRRGRPWRRPAAVCADGQALPFAEGVFELVFSNLTLQWCEDLDAVFTGLRRSLTPEGLVLFTTLGPDTLKELRWAWGEDEEPGPVHVNRFIDLHDIGDALTRAGFADPVMDREDVVMTYDRVGALFADLKGIGARNALRGRPRGLTGKRRYRALEARYETLRDAGRLPATYEIVYGHAWGPRAGLTQASQDGEARVSIESLRSGLRGGSGPSSGRA